MNYNALNAEETISLGEEFGKTLKSGDIVCLTGDLGAGKTTFTKGIAKALECVYEPVSPTFNIVNEYPGKLNVYHFDLYRLHSVEDLYSIDIDSYLFAGGVCIIEWPEIAYPLLEEYKTVNIKYNNDGRIIEINEVKK
jgi:tRNA threonylcarbamoyladenosine biosynthesis protein TsaE